MSKPKSRKDCKFVVTFYPSNHNSFPLKFYTDSYEWKDSNRLKLVNNENGKQVTLSGSISIEEQ